MLEEKLRKIIKEKLNYKEILLEKDGLVDIPLNKEKLVVEYDGFDFTGFNKSHYHNFEILSRFRGYMYPKSHGEVRDGQGIIPLFWKGQCQLVRFWCGLDKDNSEIIRESRSGDTTVDIILEIIKQENPSLLTPFEEKTEKSKNRLIKMMDAFFEKRINNGGQENGE